MERSAVACIDSHDGSLDVRGFSRSSMRAARSVQDDAESEEQPTTPEPALNTTMPIAGPHLTT